MPDPVSLALRFTLPERRDRFRSLYESRNRNRKSAEKWCHLIGSSDFLDPAVLVPIPSANQRPSDIGGALTARSPSSDCLMISENPALDGRSLAIADALAEVVGSGFGTLLLCSDSRTGYYEGEAPGDRFLLTSE